MTGEQRETPDSFFTALLGDGVLMLVAAAAAVIFAGGFAIFLAATGEFLPQDVHYLGMSARELREFCDIGNCRIVEFMVHDRAAFGGAVVGIGTLYLWLALFPLRRGEAWAWWMLAISGALGFASFLAISGTATSTRGTVSGRCSCCRCTSAGWSAPCGWWGPWVRRASCAVSARRSTADRWPASGGLR